MGTQRCLLQSEMKLDEKNQNKTLSPEPNLTTHTHTYTHAQTHTHTHTHTHTRSRLLPLLPIITRTAHSLTYLRCFAFGAIRLGRQRRARVLKAKMGRVVGWVEEKVDRTSVTSQAVIEAAIIAPDLGKDLATNRGGHRGEEGFQRVGGGDIN